MHTLRFWLVLALLLLAIASAGQEVIAGHSLATSPVLISAVYYDTYLSGEPDEAFQLWNVGQAPANLTDWSLTSRGRTVVFPATTLNPGQRVWVTKMAAAFAGEFGFRPDFEYGSDSDPTIPDLIGSAPTFNNRGDELLLRDAAGNLQDVVVYEEGNTAIEGWSGPAVQPYNPTTSFPAEGQILYRKRDPATGLPVPETDTAADWAQDPADPINGRRVQYPGWDLDAFFFPVHVVEHAHLTVMVAPDNLFDAVKVAFQGAQERIEIEAYTFENAALAQVLLDRLRAGVQVTILLEGAPAGGIEDQQKWVTQQIVEAGGQVWYMTNDRGGHDRYQAQHAKFILIDGCKLLLGSENLSYEAMPDDDKSDGTYGRRGVYLMTDAPSVVARAQAIFQADLDTAHKDIYPWMAGDPRYGAPPIGFTPVYTSGGSAYLVRKPEPLELEGTFEFELIQAPENALRLGDGLLGLVAQAGAGDVLLVEQLYERRRWGWETNDPADRNPRLEAYLAAARRGATVRIILDRYFDDPRDPVSNAATFAELNAVAAAEGLDLEVRLGNPTGKGLHNKMALAWIGGRGWVNVGSINGNETSHKVNRELALQVQSNAAYEYLAAIFAYDWVMSKPRVYLPLLARGR